MTKCEFAGTRSHGGRVVEFKVRIMCKQVLVLAFEAIGLDFG